MPESNLVLVRILVRPALLAGREKGGRMRNLVSCEFNIDTAIAMRAELDWLIYNATLSYAEMVLEGTLEQYLREAAGTYGLKVKNEKVAICDLFVLAIVLSRHLSCVNHCSDQQSCGLTNLYLTAHNSRLPWAKDLGLSGAGVVAYQAFPRCGPRLRQRHGL